MAAATSRRADSVVVAQIAADLDQRLLGAIDVLGRRAAGERDRRRRADPRVGVGEHRPGQRGGILARDRRQRADRRRPDAGVARRRACAGSAAPTAARCRCGRRRAPPARAAAPRPTRGRAAAASPGCACRATRARRWRRRPASGRGAPAPAPAFRWSTRSAPLSRTSAGLDVARSMLWRNALR